MSESMFAIPHKRVARKVFVYYEEMVDTTCSRRPGPLDFI
jgi:hypothetical protein